MTLVLDDSVVLSASYVVVRPVTTLSAMFFAYGFYVPLFVVAVRLLTHPRHRRGCDKAYFCSTVALFVFATVIAVLQTQLVIMEAIIDFGAVKSRDTSRLEQFQSGDALRDAVSSTSFYITNMSNIVADSILIHRCYIIWQKRKRIAVPLSIAVFVVSVLGFTSMIMISVGEHHEKNLKLSKQGMTLQTVYFAIDAAVNFIITLFTAFKIWSISREVGGLMGRAANRMHQIVITIILESGVLYPATIALHLALRGVITAIGMPVNLFPLIPMVAGIAPTLVIVRGKLTAKEGQTKFPTFKFSGMNSNSRSDPENASASIATTRAPPSVAGDDLGRRGVERQCVGDGSSMKMVSSSSFCHDQVQRS